MKIRITTGDWGGDYEVASGREAIQAFFHDVLANKIKLCQLSPIGSWKRSDGEEIHFRIAPALFRAGRMSVDELTATFRAADLDFTPDEIASMVQADSWMLQNSIGSIP